MSKLGTEILYFCLQNQVSLASYLQIQFKTLSGTYLHSLCNILLSSDQLGSVAHTHKLPALLKLMVKSSVLV